MAFGRKGFLVAGLCNCLARAVVALVVVVLVVVVAPVRLVRAAAAGAATSDPAVPVQTENLQHDRELDELRRQDAARDLKARGLTTRWQEHDLAELLDWRERIDAARALATEFGVKVDWRSESAEGLVDMRLRVAKALQLRAYGIIVDWRRYSWAQIEGLRLSLVAMHPGAAGTTATHSGVAAAAAPLMGARDPDALAPFDPDRRYRPPVPGRRDPDAIFEPMFASAATARSGGRFAIPHPDGLLEPTFPRQVPRPSDRPRDDLSAPRSRR